MHCLRPRGRVTVVFGSLLALVWAARFVQADEVPTSPIAPAGVAARSVGGLGKINPILALWGPWTLFAALIFWMFYTTAFVPGGQPIGALERGFGKATKFIARHLPGRVRKRDEPAGAAE